MAGNKNLDMKHKSMPLKNHFHLFVSVVFFICLFVFFHQCLIRIPLNRKYSYQSNKFRSKKCLWLWWRKSKITLIYTHRHIQAPQTYILFIYMLSDTSSRYLRTNQDTIRLQQTPNDTNRRPQKPQKAVQGCAAVRVDMEWRLLVSVGVWWCLLVSYVVWRCEEGVWGVFSKRIWVLFMDVCTVSLHLSSWCSSLT